MTEFLNNYKSIKSNYKILKQDLEDVVKENKELQSRIEGFEEEKFGLRSCQNCHEKFSPIQNEDVRIISFFMKVNSWVRAHASIIQAN